MLGGEERESERVQSIQNPGGSVVQRKIRGSAGEHGLKRIGGETENL